MKKLISLLLAAVMLLGLAATGAAASQEAGLVVDTCILKEADDKMLNTYTVIAVNPERSEEHTSELQSRGDPGSRMPSSA